MKPAARKPRRRSPEGRPGEAVSPQPAVPRRPLLEALCSARPNSALCRRASTPTWFRERLDRLRGDQLLQIVTTLDDQMNNTSLNQTEKSRKMRKTDPDQFSRPR